ncbi:MAG: phosphoribosylformylglycinamidine synthase subunit PurL [Clostridia bacterium]|uniref:phosphoribosylformylglycinamidine synthase subunit PurL n=1 Tax=Desulfitibacter alkalitolerans TaxID=264641 RepID=UPI00047F62FE|nr:phosphoribosylformylglycinamidine synthase subunit PurL [Desulfitibacter alkalitolerans]MBS3970654.1 phosphoribosylformylglycinamidine synthase subunit PurL [Clostridia bacterium]
MEPSVWRNMGLRDDEYTRIKDLLGREPNFVEVGIFAVMWSEHCSYKTSKPVLRKFPTKGKQVIQGPGENAGVADIGNGQAVVFKIESHNHPSAVEPFQGAATGVGGIVRDVFTMGARPVALLNSLRFGSLDNNRTKYLFSGVVSGISWYGNCLGIPTVGGEVYFDKSYEGNPLVNAMCVGFIEANKLKKGLAEGIGNPVMVVGARTGRDGIHGATFASAELTEDSEESRPSVQVGDPFMEKLLLEACLEIIEEDLVVGMQDMGAAGLTSSSSEMASRAGTGLEIDTSLVPVREENMTPYEIMLSESQERMLLVPKKGSEKRVQEIFKKWGLNAVTVGSVISEPVLRIKEGESMAAEIPVAALVDESPVYHYPVIAPDRAGKLDLNLEHIAQPEDYNEAFMSLLTSPTIASKEWIYEQYDHGVGNNTVVYPGSDAAVMRVKGTNKGIALSTDCNGRYCYLDPYEGGKIAVAEAARNVVCSGALPLAITNCLNFGNPEKEEIFWQLSRCIDGMAEACEYFNTPVTGGNVSLYNESPQGAVHPTPVVGMVGLLENIENRITQDFKKQGSIIVLLGETRGELGGSEYLYKVHGLTAGKPPALDVETEGNLHKAVLEAVGQKLLLSAHDCSEGGLAVTIAESAISGSLGVNVILPAFNGRLDALLFGEDQSRIITSVENDKISQLEAICKKHNVHFAVIGEVLGDMFTITVQGYGKVIDLSLQDMTKAWREEIPCRMS